MIRTLRPGYLVSLRTLLSGGARYRRSGTESYVAGDGSTVEQWETTKHVDDPEEYARAIKTRAKCRSLVSSVCAASEFGLLCPENRRIDLDEAILEARKLATSFNDRAKTCNIGVFVITGKIASDDAEAVRAISSEIRDLLGIMQQNIRDADPNAVRATANRAKQLAAMLSDDTQNKVSAAIEEAREAAKTIAKLEKSNIQAAEVMATIKLEAIQGARFAFLDFEVKKAEPAPLVVPALDLAPEKVVEASSSVVAPVRQAEV